jgi:NADH dehydrogenase
MKIAITGGTGLVGSAVARHLAAERHEIVLVARGVTPSPTSLETGPGYHLVRANVSKPGNLTKVFTGCEAVIHCAGIRFERGEQTFERVHRQGTSQVVEAARQAGVRKIVLLSFLRARPGCGSSFHESKWAAEELVRRSGMDYTILKCGVIYGSGDHMLDHLSHGYHTFPIFPFVGFKDRGIRPIAVEDVVSVIRASVVEGTFSRRTLAVLGPELLTLHEAMRRVASVVGRHPLMFPMPIWFHLLFARCLERCMVVPMISLAQVRMMAEGIAEAEPACELVPAPWAPSLRFTTEQIRKGLPPPGPFTRAHFLCPARRSTVTHRHHSRVFFEMP